MQGRKCLLAFAVLWIVSCSSNPLMKPDCHSCTAEEQEWEDFAWEDLPGQWRGEVEVLKNEKGAAKKDKQQKKVEIRIFTAGEFLKARGELACAALPENALVVNGLFWGDGQQEYEAFLPTEDDKVSYGRLAFEKVNGNSICQFRRLGRVMGKNRLDLPAVSFSESNGVKATTGRSLASALSDNEVHLEFLRFAARETKAVEFTGEGRRPASVDQQEKPPFILRVVQSKSREGGERGQWTGTDEQIYRLWKVK
jgi:hypothetical protein